MQSGPSSQERRDGRTYQSDAQAQECRFDDLLVVEEFDIPAKRKTGPDTADSGVVERVDDDHKDGNIEERVAKQQAGNQKDGASFQSKPRRCLVPPGWGCSGFCRISGRPLKLVRSGISGRS